jgi:uncharacterized protein (TIGR03435 family)
MRHIIFKFVLVVAASAAIAAAQAPAQKPSFPVALIQLSPDQTLVSTGTELLYTLPDGRFTANAVYLRVLIFYAYGLQTHYQLIGGPDWMDTARWNIQAIAKGNPTAEQRNVMLQSLLEDKFMLKLHWETRELPVYDLTVAEDGIKVHQLQESNCVEPNVAAPPSRPFAPGQRLILTCGEAGLAAGTVASRIDGGKVSMGAFIRVLETILDRPIIDKTGFTGTFDVDLIFAHDGASAGAPGAPTTISIAIQEQLGLKLVSAKGPVDVLVIDSVQKPSEN